MILSLPPPSHSLYPPFSPPSTHESTSFAGLHDTPQPSVSHLVSQSVEADAVQDFLDVSDHELTSLLGPEANQLFPSGSLSSLSKGPFQTCGPGNNPGSFIMQVSPAPYAAPAIP